MTKQVQLRRGSDTEHNAFTGALGELTYVSDDKTLRIHDASTAGGIKVITEGTGTTNVSNNTVIAGTLGVTGDTTLTSILLTEKSADPANPAEGSSVIWQSDGTGFGSDGDILVKITAGESTKAFTLVRFTPETYSVTGTEPEGDRTYAADATTVVELANVLGTLLFDLRNRGIIS